jgi:nitrate/nitrite transport system substrate-binding protein
MWTRYWLASGGIHPDRDVALVTIPPPQMLANMKVGKIDGFCVSEPWGARAIIDGIGFTAISTQQMWRDHPEKVLAFTEEFAAKNPKTVKSIMRALLEAGRWCDKPDNRPRLAEVVAQPQYVNVPKEMILPRLLGEYDYGDGRKERDPYAMTFFERQANFPLKSHGVWFLSQFRRWGMLKEPPDYKTVVDRVHRPDLFREVAKELAVETPREDMKKETLWDGITFDPAEPERYAKSFAIHSMV